MIWGSIPISFEVYIMIDHPQTGTVTTQQAAELLFEVSKYGHRYKQGNY